MQEGHALNVLAYDLVHEGELVLSLPGVCVVVQVLQVAATIRVQSQILGLPRELALARQVHGPQILDALPVKTRHHRMAGGAALRLGPAVHVLL